MGIATAIMGFDCQNLLHADNVDKLQRVLHFQQMKNWDVVHCKQKLYYNWFITCELDTLKRITRISQLA